MNEASRQSYLRAMGLTPWVAHTALPGAAPSPWLEWEDEQDVSSTPAEVVSASSATVSPDQATPAVAEPVSAGVTMSLKDSLASPAKPKAVPEAGSDMAANASAAPAPAKGKDLVFTLEAHLGTHTWLLCAQEDTQAPGLGRFEAPLMASLLALFQSRPGRPRRFFCPLTDQPMQAGEAAQALSAFIAGLCEQAGGERVLLALPESLNQALFAQPRYQPFEIAGHPALVISGLGEMLAEPAIHKKASWQAMQEHGFDGT